MIRSRTEALSGWGRYPVQRCPVYRPEAARDVPTVLTAAAGPLIPRGLGRSYGDAALNPDGVLSTLRLDRFLAFDPAAGVLECEAGVSLGDVVETFLPRGFFPLVTPGTRHVTVGGAIACDVHGKNHHVDGTFAAGVLGFRLALPTGDVVECARDAEPELFWATVGGMGLTGVILTARLQLRPVEAAAVRVDYRRTRGLDETLDAFHREDQDYRYSVAWIDCLARGPRLGRSVLMRANDAPADGALRLPRRRGLAVPLTPPSGLLNRFSIRWFNALYYGRHPDARDRPVPYDRYFWPLDGIGAWNRLYGPRGFVQYQVALPPERGRDGLVALLERIGQARRAPFLAVLKRFGAANHSPLSFPMEGYTLALDLPVTQGLEPFVRTLDRITLDHGGRVYLAKDALLDAATFHAMYPRADEFLAVRRRVDPEGRLASSLARRVGLA
jgi:decaprenylphospho-beta-D-ribofuranose 2-oxidase